MNGKPAPTQECPPSPQKSGRVSRSRVEVMKAWLDANSDRVERMSKGSLVFYIGKGDVAPELVEKFEPVN